MSGEEGRRRTLEGRDDTPEDDHGGEHNVCSDALQIIDLNENRSKEGRDGLTRKRRLDGSSIRMYGLTDTFTVSPSPDLRRGVNVHVSDRQRYRILQIPGEGVSEGEGSMK